MILELLKVGHCYHPEFITIKGGSWKSIAFPAIVGLLKHPTRGFILFDTGYSQHFLRATQAFPERLYRWTTPMHLPEKESLIGQLAQRNIAAEDIRYIFISHFHADHIAGLKDFPQALYICSTCTAEKAKQQSRWKNLIRGHLSQLIPADFYQRVLFIEDRKDIELSKDLSPFSRGYDLFDDGALLAVSLPGHAHGHFGLVIHTNNKSYFLVADACWSIKNLNDNHRPHPITRLIFSDTEKYYATLYKLNRLHSENTKLTLLPSHCRSSFETFRDQSH